MDQDDALTAYFDAGRTVPPQPREAFLADLNASMQAATRAHATPRFGAVAEAEQALHRLHPWALLKAALGGMPGLAGLTAAAAMGVMIGVVPSLTPGVISNWQQGSDAWLVDPLPALESQLDLALVGE